MHGETILCVAPRAWDSLWRDTQPIMWRIARHNRVLYFEPGHNPDKPHLLEMCRNSRYFGVFRPRALDENLILIPTPACLPVMRRHLPGRVLRITVPWITKINGWIMSLHIHRAMKAIGVQAPILWLYSPSHIDLVGKFGEKLSCYYNYDEFPDFTHNKRIKNVLRQMDNNLSSAVDVVFSTSRAQYERRKALNSKTHFVPNGVDFELFSQALTTAGPLPPDIAALPRPIIGFVGWMGYHIDVSLLWRVAQEFPDCSLVLIGPDELPTVPDKRRLYAAPNVHFLGRKDRNSLPDYLRAFDAALMPYSLTGHILSSYPLKLHEYLAAGRSVVSTALPELRPYQHVVRIAVDHNEFVQQVSEALLDQSSLVVRTRVSVAKQNTWDDRVADIYRALGPFLESKSIQPCPAALLGEMPL